MRGERSIKKTWDEETGVPYTPEKLELRPLVEKLIQEGKYPKEEGGVVRVKADRVGDVDIVNKEGEIFFRFVNQNMRLFVLTGELLVERVSIPPPAYRQKDSDPLVEALYGIIRTDDYPDKNGETLVIPYDIDENLVILTRTTKGIVADFTHLDQQLFYDFGKNKVLAYKTPALSVAKERKMREERIRVEQRDPEIMEQLGYRGETEEIDIRVYNNEVVCACGNKRWIKNADVFQVKTCKPCAWKKRTSGRKKKVK